MRKPAKQQRRVDLRVYLIGNFSAKKPPGSARADGPGIHIFWVRPDEVTESAFVGDLLVALDGSDLIQCFDVWRKTSVHAEDLFIYQLEENRTGFYSVSKAKSSLG